MRLGFKRILPATSASGHTSGCQPFWTPRPRSARRAILGSPRSNPYCVTSAGAFPSRSNMSRQRLPTHRELRREGPPNGVRAAERALYETVRTRAALRARNRLRFSTHMDNPSQSKRCLTKTRSKREVLQLRRWKAKRRLVRVALRPFAWATCAKLRPPSISPTIQVAGRQARISMIAWT